MSIIRDKNKVIYPKLSYVICGLCFKIHNKLGKFRNEKQYADALENLLKENNLNYKREFAISPSFKGEQEGRNIIDFVIEDKIIIDLKAKPKITKEDYYQIQRYLISLNKKLGIIINFRRANLQPKRILNPKFK